MRIYLNRFDSWNKQILLTLNTDSFAGWKVEEGHFKIN